MSEENEALEASKTYQSKVEDSMDYIERFDILETINNVGNDEVFTPVKTCQMILDILPDEVWHNPDYKWLNPCDKNGVFLREIAIRLDKGLKNVPGYEDDEVRRKHIMTEMLYSIALTKFTALVSRRTNYYCSVANRKPDGDIDSDGHYKNGYSIGYGEWFDTEEGNILSPITEHDFVRGKCKFCGTAEAGRYTDPTQNEHYAYEFIHVNHLNLERHLQDRFFKGDRNMKFDIIIGNPPYQLANGTGPHTNDSPIYQHFVSQAISLNPRYLCMIIPSKWITGGMGLNDFRDKMISDTHIKVLHDYPNAKSVFPDVQNMGGVLYFLWDKDYSDKCTYTIHYNSKIESSIRYLDSGDGIVVRFPALLSAKNFVQKKAKNYFDSLVSAIGAYGKIKAKMQESISKNDGLFTDTQSADTDYHVFGLDTKNKRCWKYLSKSYELENTSKCLDKYKVFIAEGYGCPSIGEANCTPVLSEPVLGKPNDICTESFLEIGPFESKDEANHCIKYIKTKFFRALVGIKKQTQHGTQKVYSFVPKEDFTSSSDIHWEESINQINEALYTKYVLDKDVKEFINNNIEAMD